MFGAVNVLIKNRKDINSKQRYKCKICLKTFILDESKRVTYIIVMTYTSDLLDI